MCPPHSDNCDCARNFLSSNDFRFPQNSDIARKLSLVGGHIAYPSQAVAHVKTESDVTDDAKPDATP